MNRSAWIVWTSGSALVLVGCMTIAFTTPSFERTHASDELELQATQPTESLTSLIDVEPMDRTTTATTSIVPKPHRLIRDPFPEAHESSVRVPVLMYHYVRPMSEKLSRAANLLSVTPERFEAQMKELVDSGYTTITPNDLDNAIEGRTALPSKSVLISFDDGYRDQYMNAFPVLFAHKLHATFFIITDYLSYQAYMSAMMIRVMEHTGVATIGSHTLTHAMLGALTTDRQRREIFDSKKHLEQEFGHPIETFAYPYGSFTTATVAFVKEAGYHTAFSTIPGSLHVPHAKFELRRIRVLDQDHIVPLMERLMR